MKLAWLIKKFPYRYLVSVFILATGAIFLGIWLLFQGAHKAPPISQQSKPLPAFQLSEVVLCGNTLVDRRTGEIIAKQWLEGFGDNPPKIRKVFPEEQLVIVEGNQAMLGAYGFDGKAKHLLNADKKPIGTAAYNKDFSEVVYPRGGNLWHGSVNWIDGVVSSTRKLTDSGFARPDTFQSVWVWLEDELFFPLMGKTICLNLASGAVKEIPLDLRMLQHGMSPMGTFAVTPVGGRELGIANLLNGDLKKLVVGQRIRKFLWLTPTKVAIHVGINQVAQYDHAGQKLDGPRQFKFGVGDIAAPSPDGSCFLVLSGDGLTVTNLASKKDAHLKLPFNVAEWISNEELLCSCNVIDTDQRGMWLVKKTGEMERVSTQPMNSSKAAGGGSTTLRTQGGAIFIAGGNLWSYDRGSKELKQLTQSAQLHAPIQEFPK